MPVAPCGSVSAVSRVPTARSSSGGSPIPVSPAASRIIHNSVPMLPLVHHAAGVGVGAVNHHQVARGYHDHGVPA